MRRMPETNSLELNAGLLQRYFPEVSRQVQPLLETGARDPVLGEPVLDEAQPHLLNTDKSNHTRFHILIGTCPRWMRQRFDEQKDRLYRLVWIEPNVKRIARALPLQSLTPILSDPRARILTGESYQSLDQLLREDITAIGIWGLQIWLSKEYNHPSLTTPWMEVIRPVEAIAIENASIQYRQGPQVQKNIISNFPYILRSTVLDQWKDAGLHSPAVVIGAGPSLDKNIEHIAENQASAVIVAVDTALKPCLKRGIVPDVVVSCDPTALNTRHFVDIQLPDSTLFAYLPEIHAGILPMLQPRNTLCLLDTNSKLLQALLQSAYPQIGFHRGMNVGFCAYSLARVFGCSPVILAGMDLSFQAGKLSHAQGTANTSTVEIDSINRNIRLNGNIQTKASTMMEVEGYDGAPVKTFTHFHLVLQRLAHDIRQHHTHVINATEGGAKIAGTLQMPLHEAMQPFHEQKPALKIPCAYLESGVLQQSLRSIQQYRHELASITLTLERGTERVQHWIKEVHSSTPSCERVQEQADTFLQRWQQVLGSEILDVSVDIGLAPLRFDTYRLTPPNIDDPQALALWWRDWLCLHFETLHNEIEIYRQLYENVLNSFILT